MIFDKIEKKFQFQKNNLRHIKLSHLFSKKGDFMFLKNIDVRSHRNFQVQIFLSPKKVKGFQDLQYFFFYLGIFRKTT